jgi:hypothetical protein
VKKISILGVVALVVAMALWTSAVAADGSPSSLVGWWRFDGNAADSSENSNHGTLIDGGYELGRYGEALILDGVDDYVRVEDSFTLDITDELTIEAWVRTSSTTRNQQIVDKGEHKYEEAYMLMIYGGDLYGRVNKDNDTACIFPYPGDGEWHYVVYTFKTGEQYLYLDGVPVISNDGSGSIKTSDQPLLIGKGVEREIYYWVQNIDEVRIWNRALSADEVAWLASPEVDIDIKPGSDPNSINLGSKGVIPVAILSSISFDATQVDPDTVSLAGAGVAVRGKGNKSLAHHEDANGDGLLDLVVQVETENLDPNAFQDGNVVLEGWTFDDLPFRGEDVIVIVPPE